MALTVSGDGISHTFTPAGARVSSFQTWGQGGAGSDHVTLSFDTIQTTTRTLKADGSVTTTVR